MSVSRQKRVGVAVVLGAVGLASIVSVRVFSEKSVTDTVTLNLPGLPTDIRGMDVRVGPLGAGSGDLLRPHRIVIRAFDGAEFSLEAQSSSVLCSDGRVSGVYIRRPVRPVRFQQAKAGMLRTLADLHIEPDYGMKRSLSLWTDDAPGVGEGVIPYDWKAGIRTPFHGLLLDVQISPDRDGGWYYLLMFSALTPDLVPGISPTTQPSAAPAARTVKTWVRIGGNASEMRGINAHVGISGFGEADLLQSQDVTLLLPDGEPLSIPARSCNVIFFSGVAQGVFIRRPMKTVRFKDAKADMLGTLEQLHIQQDKTLKSLMSDWPEDAPAIGEARVLPQFYQTAIGKPVHGADVTIRLCPDPDGGWYYFLIFSTAPGGNQP